MPNKLITPISSTILFALILLTATSLICTAISEWDLEVGGFVILFALITIIYTRFHLLYRKKLAEKTSTTS